ncbi:MAG: hypothetical protein ACFFBJ_03250 [Promethearchaeota archaeon]
MIYRVSCRTLAKWRIAAAIAAKPNANGTVYWFPKMKPKKIVKIIRATTQPSLWLLLYVIAIRSSVSPNSQDPAIFKHEEISLLRYFNICAIH